MEFSSLRYLFFWSITGEVFLIIAFLALERVKIPFYESFRKSLKPAIYTQTLFSHAYAFFIVPLREPDLANGSISAEISSFCANLLIVSEVTWSSVNLLWYLDLSVADIFFSAFVELLCVLLCFHYVYLRYIKCIEMGNLLIGVGGPLLVYPAHALCCALLAASLFSLHYLAFSRGPLKLEHVHASFLCLFISIVRVPFYFRKGYFRKVSSEGSEGNCINMILGMLAYVVSQYCIQEKSVSLMVMLSSFAIYWLSFLAMIQSQSDFGILNFLIFAILDCAISLFGLHIYTWIVGAACFGIHHLRRKLDDVTLRYPRARTSTLKNWLSLEKKIRETPDHLIIRQIRIIMIRFIRQIRIIMIRFRRSVQMEKERMMRMLGLSLPCADDSSMEETKRDQEGENRDELIDELHNFVTLQQPGQKVNEKEAGSRDELIRTLYRLYFRLCKEEEKGKGDQTSRYQIALCLSRVLSSLQKTEQGKEQEKEGAKEVEENEKAGTEEAEIIRLYRLIFGMLSLKQGSNELKRGGEEEEEEEDIQQNKDMKEVEGIDQVLAKEAQIERLCRLILGQLLLISGKEKKIKDE